jgi:chemotaxis protein CheX
VVKAIHASTSEVFGMMLNLEVSPGEAYSEMPSCEPTDGVVALVGLAGAWAGLGVIQCEANMACTIYSQLLNTPCDIGPEGVNGDVLDAVAELANMVIGNVKNALEGQLGVMGMSVPTVVFGRKFTTRRGSNDPWTVVPFTCGESQLLVKLALTHNPGSNEVRRGFALHTGFPV